VRPFYRHKGLIALTTVIVAASALFASLAQKKVYRATAVVRVPASADTAAEMARLRGTRVRTAVARQAGITPKVTIARASRADQIKVTAEAGSARGAANLANGYVAVHLAQVHDDQAAATAGPANDLHARIAETQRQLDALDPEIASARPQAAPALVARRDTLQHQLADLQGQLAKLTDVPGPQVAGAARPPSAASSPHPVRNTLIGAAVGLLVGLFVAFAVERLATRRGPQRDDGVERPLARRVARPKRDPSQPPLVPAANAPRSVAMSEPPPPPPPPPTPTPTPSPQSVSVSEAEPVVAPEGPVVQDGEQEPAPEPEGEPAVDRSGPGVPVLGMIPAVSPWRSKERPLLRRDQPTSPAAEAYRGLAATLQHILPHRPLRSLVVTSPAKGDGRTTVVANLGIVLARAGRTVVVVDCDLRNPQLHALYGLPNEAGFTSVLRGEAPLSRAVQDVPDEPRLQVLAAGPTPPAPGQLLSAQRTVEVLAALQAQADVVVIDTPTMAPASDAAVVASISDVALVIAGAPSGQAGELARAVDILDEIEGLVVGVVLNAVADDEHDGRVAMLRRDMPRVSLA
jgi:capsular exopolysaccharide synthesis family protein